MKKRILSLLVVGCMTFGLLAGCGSTSDSTDSTDTTSEAAAETSAAEETADTESSSDELYGEGTKVGVCVQSIGNDFGLAVSEGIQEVLEAVGCEVQVDSAETDVTTQISQIENFVSMGMDIIVVWPVNAEAVASAVQNAVDAGVYVLAFATEIEGASAKMVSADEYEMGNGAAQMASEWIDETFPDAGDGEVNVLVLTASTEEDYVERCDGLLSIAELNSKVTVDSIETENLNDQDTGRTLVENYLVANPDVDVILSVNSTTALGAESYVMSSEYGLEDYSQFAIFCVDQTDEIEAKMILSETNESVIRGCVSMGTIADTLDDFMEAMEPMIKGTPTDVNGSFAMLWPEDVAE